MVISEAKLLKKNKKRCRLIERKEENDKEDGEEETGHERRMHAGNPSRTSG